MYLETEVLFLGVWWDVEGVVEVDDEDDPIITEVECNLRPGEPEPLLSDFWGEELSRLAEEALLYEWEFRSEWVEPDPPGY